MATKVRPLHDRIIVERIDEGEQKIGGIIIPDTAKEKPMQGKVIAVGKGRIEKDGKVTPLDVVLCCLRWLNFRIADIDFRQQGNRERQVEGLREAGVLVSEGERPVVDSQRQVVCGGVYRTSAHSWNHPWRRGRRWWRKG